jgi:hypothetical protein
MDSNKKCTARFEPTVEGTDGETGDATLTDVESQTPADSDVAVEGGK